jgi:hypothetical protein
MNIFQRARFSDGLEETGRWNWIAPAPVKNYRAPGILDIYDDGPRIGGCFHADVPLGERLTGVVL